MCNISLIYRANYIDFSRRIKKTGHTYLVNVIGACKKIQIISVPIDKLEGEETPVPRFINATFDMDICKCSFNGTKLIVRDWNKLVERYDYIVCTAGLILDIYPHVHNDIIKDPRRMLEAQRHLTDERKEVH